MHLDGDTCYAAMVARDPRFDGAFFVGVSTTGVYCRPVCPARAPRRDRCTFFRSPAEAEKAGYRACFRCRPELAPGRAPMDAVSHLVGRAVRLVDEGFLNRASVEDLSDRLGVTARHLRRATEAELGLSPVELAQSRRLALAKRLLQDSALPVTDVAFASGFSSVRRFNAAFAERFARTPSSVRRGTATGDALVLRLDHHAPLDWDALTGFFGPRAVAPVERVEDGAWHRRVHLDGHEGTVVVRPEPHGHALRAEVALELLPVLMALVARLRRTFDLDARPHVIGDALGADPLLAALVARRPGLRVPGAFDPLEAAIRAVLGQQVSVAAATTLATRLVERFGGRFPTAAELAHGDLDGLGVTGQRVAALRALGERVLSGRDDLDDLRGFGPWTRSAVAMRTGDPDAFPAADLGLRKALGGISAAEIEGRAEAWRPWRAYATLHLWTALARGELP